MSRRLKLVVSDFHVGKGRVLADGTQNILEDFIYDREWAEFLNFYSSGEFSEADVELILNGDILNLLQMDSWGVHTHMVTERSVVRAVKKIIEGHPVFFQALRRFMSTPNHRLAYVIGNHDAGMMFPQAREVFREAVGAPIPFFEANYSFDGIWVEHGQQYEQFSAIDLSRPFITSGLPEPVLNLPWGSLFVAVLLPKIKQERPHVDKVRPFSAFIKWVIIHDLFWGVKTAGLILLFVIETLIFKTRFQIHQGVRATFGLLKEISIYPNYDKIAFQILEDHDEISTVIFGHTHVLRYRQWREGKEYFNEGTWNETTNLYLDDYGRQTRLTYAFIEYVNDDTEVPKPRVRIKQWNGVWKPEVEVLI